MNGFRRWHRRPWPEGQGDLSYLGTLILQKKPGNLRMTLRNLTTLLRDSVGSFSCTRMQGGVRVFLRNGC